MDKSTYKLTRKLMTLFEARYAEYLKDCESYVNEGFRPKYCEHGTNNWTDYDNICGPCEDGETFGDRIFLRKTALYEAKRRIKKTKRLIEIKTELERDFEIVDTDFMNQIHNKVFELMMI